MKISSFVLFILIGSTVFSLSFQARRRPGLGRAPADQPARRPARLPDRRQHPDLLPRLLPRLLRALVHRHSADRAGGRQARHRPGLVRRAARGEHADLVHAPAVRLRALLPAQRRAERRLRRQDHRASASRAVTTGQIYWGAVPFVLIQILMVGLIIAFPKLVSSGLGKEPTVDVDKAFQQMQMAPKEPSRDATRCRRGRRRRPGGAGAAPRRRAGAESSRRKTSDDEAMKRRPRVDAERRAEEALTRPRRTARQEETPPRRGFVPRPRRRGVADVRASAPA